jgi:hypothetical protein
MTTEIIPAAPEPTPVADGVVVGEAPKKKRRGWIIALIVLAALVVLGVVAFLVADAIAKQYAREYVRERIVAVLQLPEGAEVDVDLGGGSIILQALAGRVDTVDVDVPEASFGELTGDVRLHAEGVPLDEDAPVDALSVDFAIDADDLASLSQGEDAAAAPAFEFVDGEVSLNSEFEIFGASVPLGLTFVPSAAEGSLVLTPTSLTIGTQTFESGAEDGSFLGQIAASLLQPQTLCIAGSVPQALVLDDASIDAGELVLTFRGDGAALGGPEFSTPGTCPAG